MQANVSTPNSHELVSECEGVHIIFYRLYYIQQEILHISHICLHVCLNLSLGLFDELYVSQTKLCFETFNSSIQVHFFCNDIFLCHMEEVPYFYMEFNLTRHFSRLANKFNCKVIFFITFINLISKL